MGQRGWHVPDDLDDHELSEDQTGGELTPRWPMRTWTGSVCNSWVMC